MAKWRLKLLLETEKIVELPDSYSADEVHYALLSEAMDLLPYEPEIEYHMVKPEEEKQ